MPLVGRDLGRFVLEAPLFEHVVERDWLEAIDEQERFISGQSVDGGHNLAKRFAIEVSDIECVYGIFRISVGHISVFASDVAVSFPDDVRSSRLTFGPSTHVSSAYSEWAMTANPATVRELSTTSAWSYESGMS
ncbi:hypothetical protein HFX_5095 (plasmid) [Haloferax mediterranei ATCC 33500]|uniref:Uncharacterized protein n=1 Tax=Haloferax mediterranei (strain ATCC 33500 / DSM 1411 / JCM 8866 / NBRC 14739 / NCIMB 2177 / R-4) TaxID=523841 RepID=I3R9L9_HALMT|nr:hypothetical protein HFX_5095 [Haloferax mediterranei ATCC 33500]